MEAQTLGWLITHTTALFLGMDDVLLKCTELLAPPVDHLVFSFTPRLVAKRECH